jgi:hypothetical protein
MSDNPYRSLDKNAFWKNGVEKCDITFPEKIYDPKWKISDDDKIATMGSCFAQHIAKWLRENGFNVPFYEKEGFNESEQTFSANYGNIYTVRQALQLIQEAIRRRQPSERVWARDERFVDAMRPNAVKEGFNSLEATLKGRESHLDAIHEMILDFDVLIFTLGLTESWEIKKCGTALPSAPGVIAGKFDPEKYQFVNFSYNEIISDLQQFCDVLKRIRNDRPFKLLLTVSPVPLTATASGNHVLVATTYSKGVLRSVAGDFARENDFVEYFPSYEIITNPASRSSFFEDNLRSVKMSAVGNVMNVFSSSALETPRIKSVINEDFDPDCEDALLNEFSRDIELNNKFSDVICVGNSHLAAIRPILTEELKNSGKGTPYFFPINWGRDNWTEFEKNKYLTDFFAKPEYGHLIENYSVDDPSILVLVSMGLGGDDIIRCHGSLSRDSSPKLPITKNLDKKLISFYESFLNKKAHLIDQLDRNTPYNSVFWIMGPDMCMDVAIHRLGKDFVDSGSYLIHKKAYFTALNNCLNKLNKIQFIYHDDGLSDPVTGFTLNVYKESDTLFDIHCCSDYYGPSISRIINATSSLT